MPIYDAAVPKVEAIILALMTDLMIDLMNQPEQSVAA